VHPAACRGSRLSTTFATFSFDFTLPESRHSPSSANDTLVTLSLRHIAVTLPIWDAVCCRAHSIAISPAKLFPGIHYGQICRRYRWDATGRLNKLRHQASSKAGQFFPGYEETFPQVSEGIGSVSISAFAGRFLYLPSRLPRHLVYFMAVPEQHEPPACA
jgi:hypothetical protein